MGIKFRLIVMNFLQFAVWGSYLVCIGNFLGRVGLGDYISWFYIAQGVVSIFMPAIIGAIADKLIEPQRLLGISHLAAAAFMLLAAYFGYQATILAAAESATSIGPIFTAYCLSVAFYMPTIALSNTVAFSILKSKGYDTVKDFPPIRVFGTVGFIAAMWFVNFIHFGAMKIAAQFTYMQLVICGTLGLILGTYAFTLPHCPLDRTVSQQKRRFLKGSASMRSFFSNKRKWRCSSSSPCCWVFRFKLPTGMPRLISIASPPLPTIGSPRIPPCWYPYLRYRRRFAFC